MPEKNTCSMSSATPAQCAGVARIMCRLTVETMITCDCFFLCLHMQGVLRISDAYMVASLLEALDAYCTSLRRILLVIYTSTPVSTTALQCMSICLQASSRL